MSGLDNKVRGLLIMAGCKHLVSLPDTDIYVEKVFCNIDIEVPSSYKRVVVLQLSSYIPISIEMGEECSFKEGTTVKDLVVKDLILESEDLSKLSGMVNNG